MKMFVIIAYVVLMLGIGLVFFQQKPQEQASAPTETSQMPSAPKTVVRTDDTMHIASMAKRDSSDGHAARQKHALRKVHGSNGHMKPISEMNHIHYSAPRT